MTRRSGTHGEKIRQRLIIGAADIKMDMARITAHDQMIRPGSFRQDKDVFFDQIIDSNVAFMLVFRRYADTP